MRALVDADADVDVDIDVDELHVSSVVTVDYVIVDFAFLDFASVSESLRQPAWIAREASRAVFEPLVGHTGGQAVCVWFHRPTPQFEIPVQPSQSGSLPPATAGRGSQCTLR